MSDQNPSDASAEDVQAPPRNDTATAPLGDGTEPHEPEVAPDRVVDPVLEAQRTEAANVPASETADTRQPAETDAEAGGDRSAEAGRVRPSVPDEFSGVAEPSTDPNRTTSY